MYQYLLETSFRSIASCCEILHAFLFFLQNYYKLYAKATGNVTARQCLTILVKGN